MRKSGLFSGWNLLTAWLCVAIAAGVAAAESLTAAVPPGDFFVVTAVVVPGAGGAEVLGDGVKGTDNHVDLSIGFEPGGQLTVNGSPAGVYDPAAQYTVTITCSKVDGDWLADTVVHNDTTSTTVHTQVGHDMGDKPAEVTADALDVISLTCE